MAGKKNDARTASRMKNAPIACRLRIFIVTLNAMV
jgi:hypothetical protein